MNAPRDPEYRHRCCTYTSGPCTSHVHEPDDCPSCEYVRVYGRQ